MVSGTKSIKLTNLAEGLLKKGGNEEAIEALKRSIKLGDARDMRSYVQVAAQLYQNGDYEHARLFLGIFLESWVAAEAYFILGAVCAKENKIEEAVSYYEQGLTIYEGNNITPYHECLLLYIKLNNDNRATNICKRILQINYKDKEAIVFLAHHHRKMKAYKEAITFYEMLIKYKMADYDDYHYCGVCLHEIGNYAKAEEMYAAALEYYPTDDRTLLELKNLRMHTLEENYPNLKESEIMYHKKIEEEPDVSSYFHLGNIEFINGNYEKAVVFYTKAKELFEESMCV